MNDEERERALDDGADLDLSAFDMRCRSCGALFATQVPQCDLCGSTTLEPVEDLAW